MKQELKMPPSAINTRTTWHPILRPIARLLVLAQLALVLQPLSVLAQDKGSVAYNPLAQSQINRINLLNRDIESAKAQKLKDSASPADKASAELSRIEEISKTLNASGPQLGTEAQRSQHLTELQDLLARQSAAQGAISAEFNATRLELQQKNLPADILARHDEAVAQFAQRSQQFNQIARKLQNVSNPAPNQASTQQNITQQAPNIGATASTNPLTELNAFFQQHPNSKRTAPSVDPQNAQRTPKKLPWSTPEPTKRAPAETKTSWNNNLHKDYYAAQSVKLAQAGSGNIGGIQFTQLPEPTETPTPADLAETAEIQLTPAIRAKAQELDNNPVEIHNWVRNTLQWQPTWGAMQSADNVLQSQRGNSADIASLQIALLRAAGIPARYQFGTIEITAEQAMNWVGGVTQPEAALQLLGQGGIANRGIAEGGRFAKVRMEHVWVQAYVNWAPSRGAKDGGASLTPKQHVNPNGALNAWVPLDASFKQYSYTAGLDLKTQVPLDAIALLSAAQTGATVNAAQGWVQNLNQAAISNELATYQTRLKTYIDSTPSGANSTVGDVIGKKIIPQQAHPMLAGSLPYAVVLAGNQAASIPSSQQHQFTYRLNTTDPYGYDGTEILRFTDKLSNLVGKRLTLSYVPATQSDADTIASYLPKANADGSPIRPDQLPTSLPGYLIRLKAQINLDGVPVATSSTALPMGTDLASTGGFTQLYDASQWDLTSESSNVVGQATAIGISAGGISANQLTHLKDRLAQTHAKLQAGNVTGLTGEQISGDLLTATVWSWFAAAESHNRISQNQANMVESQGLSYGLFHAVAQPVYSWGVVRKVTFPGVNMDIGHIRNLSWSKDNNRGTWIAYNRLRGQYMSALEHAIPERFFNDPTKCNAEGTTTPIAGLPACPQGISAVKAIGLAAAHGQKIYTITQEVYRNNPNIVNTNLATLSQSTKQGIQNALDAGHEVTTHESPITQSGWSGSGYTFIDPETGAGGYIIDGGSNGGYKENLSNNVGVKLLNFFGVGEQPKTFHAPALATTVALSTLAIYSAVNTVQELWDCYKQQIGDAVLTILLFLAAAVILAALLGTGGLAGGLATALLILTGTSTANAATKGRPTCALPTMRVQFQVSPRSSGTQTLETFGQPIEGKEAQGVTLRQVRDKMSAMFSARPPWIPSGVELSGMIVAVSECIKRYPPFGTSGASREQICPQQLQYNGLYYRVDLENLNGVNLKIRE